MAPWSAQPCPLFCPTGSGAHCLGLGRGSGGLTSDGYLLFVKYLRECSRAQSGGPRTCRERMSSADLGANAESDPSPHKKRCPLLNAPYDPERRSEEPRWHQSDGWSRTALSPSACEKSIGLRQ